MGGSGGGGDSGLSKSTAVATIGDRISGINAQTFLWIMLGVGVLALATLILVAFKD